MTLVFILLMSSVCYASPTGYRYMLLNDDYPMVLDRSEARAYAEAVAYGHSRTVQLVWHDLNGETRETVSPSTWQMHRDRGNRASNLPNAL